MSLIIGKDGFKKFQVGYETNVNDSLRRGYAVSQSATGGIRPGDLLVTTTAPQVYNRATAALTTEKIAGIALATNVLLDKKFPQSDTEVVFDKGVRGAALIRGSIAVPFTGSAVLEGAAVYYDFTARAFTGTEGSNIALPGARFTGKVEGNVAEIYVQYI